MTEIEIKVTNMIYDCPISFLVIRSKRRTKSRGKGPIEKQRTDSGKQDIEDLRKEDIRKLLSFSASSA